MSSDLIQRLPTLKPESGVRIPTSNMYQINATQGAVLIATDLVNGNWVGRARYGTSKIQDAKKVLSFTNRNNGFIDLLNSDLKGGYAPHPVLTFVLGTGMGMVSGGIGFVFGAASCALEMSRKSQNVLARSGDEIWRVEAIGKVYESVSLFSKGWVAKHVSSYILYDPFRAKGYHEKGWLIHESRTDVIFG